MPLIFNGTTIPENVANVLSFNGTNITNVVFNGTNVWTQSLFSGVWSISGKRYSSGSSGSLYISYGLELSGSAYRMIFYDIWNFYYGGWLYVNASTGLANGTTSASSPYRTAGVYSTTTTLQGFSTISGSVTAGYVYFSTTNKFSGSSLFNPTFGLGFNTSGGMIRAVGNYANSEWFTLN